MVNLLKPFAIPIKENGRIRDYFVKCSESIDTTNRYTLIKACMYFSIGYIFMVIYAYLIVPDFSVNKVHLSIIPFLVIYFFINLNYRSRNDISTLQTSVTCLFFYFYLAVHFILLDVVYNPNQTATWIPLIMICFPIVFIDHMIKYLLEEATVVLIFVATSYFVKDVNIFLQDLYVASAAFLLSLLMASILLRVRSYEALSIDEIKQASIIDPLTLILNKRALLEEIDSYYSSRQEDDPCAICVIDVDNFKSVNDNLGHNNGDVLLSHIGALLKRNFRSSDIIGRFGGDEFVVFMPGISDKALVEMRCRSMQMFLTDFIIDPFTQFSLSIGAVVDLAGLPYNKLFAMADDALYQSKQAGKNCCTTWSVDKVVESSKPMLLIATPEVTKDTTMLESGSREYFDILRAYNGTDVIKYLSQYHSKLPVAVIHMGIANISGRLVLKYIKTRNGFENVKVMAVCSDKKALNDARSAGADAVLMDNESADVYFNTLKELIHMI